MHHANPRALRLDRITIALRDRVGSPLMDQLSLTIEPGEIVSIMGPSGCGKSTLLSYLCGTLASEFNAQGSVYLGETDLSSLPTEARRLGILFQDPLLFPHMSVAENLAFALPAKLKGSDRVQAVKQALSEAELANYGDRSPLQLSGGQQARVALMRTLLARPRALLLDEPFSKLDPELRGRIRDFVFSHARQQQLPVLMVTHDLSDTHRAGGKIFNLDQATV